MIRRVAPLRVADRRREPGPLSAWAGLVSPARNPATRTLVTHDPPQASARVIPVEAIRQFETGGIVRCRDLGGAEPLAVDVHGALRPLRERVPAQNNHKADRAGAQNTKLACHCRPPSIRTNRLLAAGTRVAALRQP